MKTRSSTSSAVQKETAKRGCTKKSISKVSGRSPPKRRSSRNKLTNNEPAAPKTSTNKGKKPESLEVKEDLPPKVKQLNKPDKKKQSEKPGSVHNQRSLRSKSGKDFVPEAKPNENQRKSVPREKTVNSIEKKATVKPGSVHHQRSLRSKSAKDVIPEAKPKENQRKSAPKEKPVNSVEKKRADKTTDLPKRRGRSGLKHLTENNATESQKRMTRNTLIDSQPKTPSSIRVIDTVEKKKQPDLKGSSDVAHKQSKKDSSQSKNLEKVKETLIRSSLIPIIIPLQNIESFVSPEQPRLRKRKNQNYLENSVETITPKAKSPKLNESRVPIYRQPVVLKADSSKHDLYEFKSDSKKPKVVKKTRVRARKDKTAVKTMAKPRKVIAKKSAATITEIAKSSDIPRGKVVDKTVEKINTNVESTTIKKNTTNVPEPVNEPVQSDIFENPEVTEPQTSETVQDPEANNNTPSKVNIISDILLSPTEEFFVATPSHFNKANPRANSTMIAPRWRFDDPTIVKVPHWILLKQSGQPYLQQEPVLEHTIVEKIPEKSSILVENAPKLRQKPITDYMSGDHSSQGEILNEISMFDENKFSPIKRSVEKRKAAPPRRILGEQNDNIIVTCSTPARDLVKEFGFTTNDSAEIDLDRESSKENKPFRFSFKTTDKTYKKKQKVKEPAPKTIVPDSSDESEPEEPESDIDPLHIFEDIDTNRDKVIQFEDIDTTISKLKKRNKNRTKPRKPRTKKADVWTKEEAEEAEKWAAEFNSMCDEVEKHTLEIE